MACWWGELVDPINSIEAYFRIAEKYRRVEGDGVDLLKSNVVNITGDVVAQLMGLLCEVKGYTCKCKRRGVDCDTPLCPAMSSRYGV